MGLFGNHKLIAEEDCLVYYTYRGKNERLLVECNKNDNSMSVYIYQKNIEKFIGIDSCKIEKDVKIVLDEPNSIST